MTDLQNKLREACKLPERIYPHGDINGVEFDAAWTENARLAPILAALAECVEALEGKARWEDDETEPATAALENLRKVLGDT